MPVNNINSTLRIIKEKQNGFIHIIVIFVMAIIILSLLGVDLTAFFKNETLQNNFDLVWEGVKSVWNKYLTEPAGIVKDYFMIYVWTPLYSVIKRKI